MVQWVQLEVLAQTRKIVSIQARRPECEGYAVCRALKEMTSIFLEDVINLELLEAAENPFISMILCADLFPQCSYI